MLIKKNLFLLSTYEKVFKHLKEAKLLKKLTGGDIVEMYKFTLTTVVTPENLKAISKGIAEAYLENTKEGDYGSR